jgi:hypothetical protein
MGRVVIGLLIGLVLGGVITFFVFVGVPRAGSTPGVPVLGPDPNGVPTGTAQIVLREQFFNDVLGTIFNEMNAPSFALGPQGTGDCLGALTVMPEGSGVRTTVLFANNRLEAPLAFRGSYNSPFGCVQFTGWANSVMELRFDQSTQSVFGQINVETVNLDGVNPIINAVVTPLVQSTLNSRVNPVRILDGQQVAVDTPIASANANLKAGVKDVRAEVKDNALNLFVVYDFASGPLVLPQQEQP